MKVLVCGGRKFDDVEFLDKTLDAYHEQYNFSRLIHGGADGADTLAGDWAHSRDVPKKVYRANWGKHGRAAGPIRNQQMLDEEHPDLVIAFKGNTGTADMIFKARKAGIKVIEV